MLDWCICHHPESAYWYIGEIMRRTRNRWDVPPKQTLRMCQALFLDGELSEEARETYFALLASHEDID